MKFLRWLFAATLLAAGILAYFLIQPYRGFDGEKFVDIPRGSSTRQIAEVLSGEGVVRSQWLFLAARACRPRTRVQAGEYRFAAPASALTIFDRLVRGDVFYYELRIPEGYNIFDIASALHQLKVISPAAFLETARSPELIRDLSPEAPSLEGYLFPDTYRITRHTSAEDLCRQMIRRFRESWTKLNSPDNVHRTVTLASLVEKETGISDERPEVASVYANRLKIGMKLDCDPTTVYAAQLEGRYRGTIYQSDLERDHPYNTYRHPGLPPGPIANPGLASLRAAAKPAETKYLYFVAQPGGSGRHQFSETLAAHSTAANRYRRANQKGPASPVSGKKRTRRR